MGVSGSIVRGGLGIQVVIMVVVMGVVSMLILGKMSKVSRMNELHKISPDRPIVEAGVFAEPALTLLGEASLKSKVEGGKFVVDSRPGGGTDLPTSVVDLGSSEKADPDCVLLPVDGPKSLDNHRPLKGVMAAGPTANNDTSLETGVEVFKSRVDSINFAPKDETTTLSLVALGMNHVVAVVSSQMTGEDKGREHSVQSNDNTLPHIKCGSDFLMCAVVGEVVAGTIHTDNMSDDTSVDGMSSTAHFEEGTFHTFDGAVVPVGVDDAEDVKSPTERSPLSDENSKESVDTDKKMMTSSVSFDALGSMSDPDILQSTDEDSMKPGSVCEVMSVKRDEAMSGKETALNLQGGEMPCPSGWCAWGC